LDALELARDVVGGEDGWGAWGGVGIVGHGGSMSAE
jgi:hypothetical protein